MTDTYYKIIFALTLFSLGTSTAEDVDAAIKGFHLLLDLCSRAPAAATGATGAAEANADGSDRNTFWGSALGKEYVLRFTVMAINGLKASPMV